MRVVGGIYRSRVIDAPTGMNTRPTMDKVKEAMFNIISFSVNGAVCVDLFSGSGSLGIEAISRGASFVYFNDHNKNSYNVIKNNLSKLGIKEGYKLTLLDYKDCIKQIDKKIDILLLDPPYKNKIYSEIIDTFSNLNLFSEHCIIVCEGDKEFEALEIEGFSYKEHLYGNKKLIVYKK